MFSGLSNFPALGDLVVGSTPTIPSLLHFTTQTAAVSDPQRESVIALLTRLNDPVAAEPGTRLLSAVTPVLAWTVDSALPPVLYLARVAAPVSIC